MLKLAIGVSSSGAQLEFTNSDIISYEGDSELSLTGDELSIDTVTVTVRYEYEYGGDIITADNYLIETSDSYILAAADSTGVSILSFARNTACTLYRDENIAEDWYLDSVKRIGVYVYEIHLMSWVGLLDQKESCTEVYSGTALSYVAQTLGYGGTVETETGKIKVYGCLLKDNARANFARFMQAYNLNLIRTATGSLLLTSMFANEAQDVPDSRIFMSGSVEKNTSIQTVEVEEYSYTLGYEAVEVFNGVLPTLGGGSTFRVYGLDMAFDGGALYKDEFLDNYTALTILQGQFQETTGVTACQQYYEITGNRLYVNFLAIFVAGTVLPTPNIVLKATPYTVNKNTVKYSQTADTTQIARITGNGLISARNSLPVAQRLINESNAEKVTADLIIDDERAGRFIGFNDMFRDNRTGFITKMHTTMSSFLKARCTIISEFVPVPQVSTYTAFVVLTDSGTWTIPSSVFTKATPLIRVTLIGGGQAGYDGENGADGSNYSYGSAAQGGAGGKGGKGGAGGAALTQEINCTGLTSFTYSCGSGGASNGALGSATTFGLYSSADGTTPTSGYINEFNGEVYCLSGATGKDGAAGGKGGVCTASANTPPTAGEDFTNGYISYKGGAAGSNKVQTWYVPEGYIDVIAEYTSGYGGGGAAYGNDGSYYSGGAGGGGTSGSRGSGGDGGHGGGGGGGGGGLHGVYNDGNYYESADKGGKGGKGGGGGPGGVGVVVIYY